MKDTKIIIDDTASNTHKKNEPLPRLMLCFCSCTGFVIGSMLSCLLATLSLETLMSVVSALCSSDPRHIKEKQVVVYIMVACFSCLAMVMFTKLLMEYQLHVKRIILIGLTVKPVPINRKNDNPICHDAYLHSTHTTIFERGLIIEFCSTRSNDQMNFQTH